MIIVTIENEGNMLRTELPKHIDDLRADLGSIGIKSLPDSITINKVKLYSQSVLGQAVIERLDNNDNLAAVNALCFQLDKGYDDTFKADIINESEAHGISELSKLFGSEISVNTDKLMLNTILDYYRGNWITSRCIVEKAIIVPHEEFMHIKTRPLKPYEIIENNHDKMFYDEKTHTEHCLLLIDSDSGDGLLVQSGGAPIVSRAQYIPNAWDIYNKHRHEQAKEVKFYCPLKVVYNIDYEDNEVYPKDAARFCESIKQALTEYEEPEEKERGLMHWYNECDEVDDKVYSAHMDVEVYNGELVGIIRARILGELTESEIISFKDYISGQLSDGAGEGFEQKPIATYDGDIYVSFWSSDDNWVLIPEDEFDGEFPDPDEDISM